MMRLLLHLVLVIVRSINGRKLVLFAIMVKRTIDKVLFQQMVSDLVVCCFFFQKTGEFVVVVQQLRGQNART